LGVDEKPQEDFFNNQNSHARADQVVFGPASTVGIQRASTNSVYSGVTLDRAVFMTSGYLADLFGAFSAEPHQYDLAWHIRGEVNSDLKFTPLTFPEPVAKGYNTLTNVRQAVADNAPWSVTLTREGHSARLHAAKAPATQVIVGDGGFYVDSTSKENNGKPTAPTILERREKTTSTIYGNALDYSDSKDGYVKNVTQEGGLDVGYGLLRVQTTNGTDLCFASYRPGNYNAEGLQTDALQAFVQMSGRDVQTLYLAGGKSLQVGGASITRSEEGLTYVEKTATGSYLVGNPSSAAATVTVTLPALAGLKAFNLDDAGKRTGPADVQAGSTPDSFTIPLKPSSKVEFASS